MNINLSPWQVFVAQVQSARPVAPKKKNANASNPCPSGIFRHGSATHAVLQMLRDNPDKTYSCFGLCRNTGHTLKAVDHACLYLCRMGVVRTYGDARNSSYLTYAISKTGNV